MPFIGQYWNDSISFEKAYDICFLQVLSTFQWIYWCFTASDEQISEGASDHGLQQAGQDRRWSDNCGRPQRVGANLKPQSSESVVFWTTALYRPFSACRRGGGKVTPCHSLHAEEGEGRWHHAHSPSWVGPGTVDCKLVVTLHEHLLQWDLQFTTTCTRHGGTSLSLK